MRIGATAAASLLVVLDRPSTWPLALASFLIRGGWLLIVAPVVVLPTAVGVANVIAPLLEDVAFGRRTAELIAVVALLLGGTVAWLLAGGFVAAVAEVELVRQVANELGIRSDTGAVTPGIWRAAWRVTALRLAAHVPFVIAFVWGAVRFASVGYAELTVPSDVTVPAVWRIAAGAPDAIVLLAGTWLIGETVGALGARRVVLAGERARTALRIAVGVFFRSTVRWTALAVLSTIVLLVVIVVTGLATGAALEALRAGFAAGDGSAGTTALVVVFVGLFTGGLVLVGLVEAWRAALWTVVAGAHPDGTFGGVSDTRSGD